MVDKDPNLLYSGLETWGKWNNLTTGLKWAYLDQVLKLDVQRAGAFEGTVSRMVNPTMEGGRSGSKKPESNTGGSQTEDIPREKGASPKPSPPLPP